MAMVVTFGIFVKSLGNAFESTGSRPMRRLLTACADALVLKACEVHTRVQIKARRKYMLTTCSRLEKYCSLKCKLRLATLAKTGYFVKLTSKRPRAGDSDAGDSELVWCVVAHECGLYWHR